MGGRVEASPVGLQGEVVQGEVVLLPGVAACPLAAAVAPVVVVAVVH